MNHKSIYNLYTIGHSVKSIEIFITKLKENGIAVLVDVRTIPFSRWQSQYNKITLEASLTKAGIYYLYRGQNLGGKAENTGYEEAIDELTALAVGGKRVCVMCSEGDYRKCHRYTILAPSLEDRGLSIVHIEYEKQPKLVALKRATN